MTNTERIQAHNAELRELIETAESLPDAGGAAEAVIESLSVTANGTYTAPDGVDGYSPVTVNVPIPDGYIVPSGTLDVTENGTHDVTQYASVAVNVPTGGGGGASSTVEDGIITRTISDKYTNDRVTSVGDYAFYKCGSLKEVEFQKVKTLGVYAFWNSGVQSVVFPSLTSITGAQCFYACRLLTHIEMPVLETITGGHCFYNCTSLVSADFPMLKNIAAQAFSTNSKFATLILRSSTVCVLANANAFNGTPIASGTGYIYVPSALVDTYKSATNWSTYANQIRPIEDYPEITGG